MSNIKIFCCDICTKKFRSKQNLHKHIIKKICQTRNYICSYCPTKFTTKTAMYRHMRNTCNIKIKMDNDTKEIVRLDEEKTEYKKKFEEIERECCELKRKILPSTNITINNNDNSTTNVHTTQYGKEDLTFLTENQIKQILNAGYQSVQSYVKSVHFNDDKPEYRNIYINNRKQLNYISVHNGKRWILCKDEMIKDLMDRGIEFVEGKYDELKDRLPNVTTKKMNRFIADLNGTDGGKLKTQISNELRLVLYNERPE